MYNRVLSLRLKAKIVAEASTLHECTLMYTAPSCVDVQARMPVTRTYENAVDTINSCDIIEVIESLLCLDLHQ